MPDETKDLQFKITTTADTAGAKAAADAIDAVGGAAKKTSANQYDLGEDLEKVEKRVEGVSGQSREMYHIFDDMNRIAPGLGESLRGLITGPLGMIGALLFGLGEAKAAWDRYDEALEKVLGENLTEGIDKAQALAQAFTGITDAVASATTAWDSSGEVLDRALKNIQAQLGFTRQLIQAEKDLALQRLQSQKQSGQISESDYEAKKAAVEGESRKAGYDAERRALQAELTQKINAAANAQAQADAAKKKAESFRLAPDAVAKADEAALAEQEKSRREQGGNEIALAARIRDATASANSSALGLGAFGTGGFWDFAWQNILNHGLAAWNYQRAGQMAREQESAGRQDIDIADATATEEARREAQSKARNKAREEAERATGDATKASQEATWESNPNNAGSLAAKIRQNDALRAIAQQSEQNINTQADEVGQHIERMGNATVQGFDAIGKIVQTHTAQIKSIAESLKAHSNAIARATNYGNGPT